MTTTARQSMVIIGLLIVEVTCLAALLVFMALRLDIAPKDVAKQIDTLTLEMQAEMKSFRTVVFASRQDIAHQMGLIDPITQALIEMKQIGMVNRQYINENKDNISAAFIVVEERLKLIEDYIRKADKQ